MSPDKIELDCRGVAFHSNKTVIHCILLVIVGIIWMAALLEGELADEGRKSLQILHLLTIFDETIWSDTKI